MAVLGLNENASTVEQLITYGVPGVIALLGVWLGKTWERRSGTQSWRRDRRLDAYAGFLSVLNDLREQSRRLGDLHDAEEFRSERAKTRDVARRLQVITGQITLLGPSGVEDAAKEVGNAFRDVLDEINGWEPPPRYDDGDQKAEAGRLIDGTTRAERTFQRAAQRALK
jgi:hypothetical protein